MRKINRRAATSTPPGDSRQGRMAASEVTQSAAESDVSAGAFLPTRGMRAGSTHRRKPVAPAIAVATTSNFWLDLWL